MTMKIASYYAGRGYNDRVEFTESIVDIERLLEYLDTEIDDDCADLSSQLGEVGNALQYDGWMDIEKVRDIIREFSNGESVMSFYCGEEHLFMMFADTITFPDTHPPKTCEFLTNAEAEKMMRAMVPVIMDV